MVVSKNPIWRIDAFMTRQQKFFCLGAPKSGTTLLQHCLHEHPRISCPSEHHVHFLMDRFDGLFTQYNRSLQVIDRRTGEFGASLVSSETAAKVFRATVYAMIDQYGDGMLAAGLNDNSMLDRLAFHYALFPDAKWILIFRHPVPWAVSAWHHNARLAKEESDPRHLQLMEGVEHLDAWVLKLSQEWNQTVVGLRDLLRDRERILTVLFEELVENKREQLEAVYNFLGVETTRNEIQRVCCRTDFDGMRGRAKRPHFLRSGEAGTRSREVSSKTQALVCEEASEALKILGYDARVGKRTTHVG